MHTYTHRLIAQRPNANGKLKYDSIFSAFKIIYEEEGLAGFWAGWDAALLGGAINAVLTSVCFHV